MTNTGDTNTGVRVSIREQGGKAVATAAGIPHPITTSLVTGAQVGMTNAIQKLKQ